MYTCKICGKIFDSHFKWAGHIGAAHTHKGGYKIININKKQCPKCLKFFRPCGFAIHIDRCGKIARKLKNSSLADIDKFEKIHDNSFMCKICKKIYTKYGIVQHYWRSHTNFGKKHNSFANTCSWIKGKTKNTDERVLKLSNAISKSLKERIASGKFKPKTNPQKIRETVNRKILLGEWHNSFSKSRIHKYITTGGIEVSLDGLWELNFAKYLDSLSIRWERPSRAFDYVWKNEKHKYTPDFYLIDSSTFIEIKGWITDRDLCKWKHFPFHLKVLTGNYLKSLGIIDYCKQVVYRSH